LAQAIEPQSSMIKMAENTFKMGAVEISSVREDEVPGTHEITIKLQHETITLKHDAHDPAIFATGALDAAQWIQGKAAGFYDLNAVLME
jgi:4-hydroxy-tetrahydrodipicolinate reductase